ncbi:helix-turn-helix domain-containing protein [Bdellovibrio sp. HCB337]|uniref:helix-turn-helix domain-containing protein n=1 Tax=Bdellovibrio sp. HCB337 TaxID=3394358 RepID=UPI0039A6A8C7
MPKHSLQTLHSIEALGVVHAQRGDIRIEPLEDRLTPRVPFPHKHDFFQLVFISTGTGWHEVDFEKYSLTKNQIFILKPGQVHSWKFSKNTRGLIVEFTSESLSEDQTLFQIESLPDCVTWTSSTGSPFTLLELMKNEADAQAVDYKRCLHNYLAVLLYQLFRYGNSTRKLRPLQEDLNRQFSHLVETHYRNQHGLDFYARQLKTSAKSLSAKIQRAYGKPAKEIIQDRCLLEAKRYLSYTALPVAEIGYELGFDDANYFSRFLRQRLRMSAQKFRQDYQKNHSDILSKT